MSLFRGQPFQPLACCSWLLSRSCKCSGRTASMPALPKSCEVQLPVKAASFMLERETAHFRSLVAEAGAGFMAVCWCLSVLPASLALPKCTHRHVGIACCYSAK